MSASCGPPLATRDEPDAVPISERGPEMAAPDPACALAHAVAKGSLPADAWSLIFSALMTFRIVENSGLASPKLRSGVGSERQNLAMRRISITAFCTVIGVVVRRKQVIITA